MQKLFENWREFRKETLKESVDSDALGFQAMGHTPDKIKVHPKEAKALLGLTKTIVSFVDPTGITGWSDVDDAYWKFEKDKTLASAGLYLLAFAAALPVIGKLGKTANASAKLTAIANPSKVQAAKVALKQADEASEKLKLKYPEFLSDNYYELERVKDSLRSWIDAMAYVSKQDIRYMFKWAQRYDAIWKQPAYRGEGFKNIPSLKRRLNVPQDSIFKITNRRQDEWGTWDYVELKNYSLTPKANRLTGYKKPVDENVGISFSRNFSKASEFGWRAPVHVIYDTGADNVNLIELEKITDYARQYGEQEILGIGPVKINGFWIKSRQ